MKYENKQQVETICKEIEQINNNLNSLTVSMENGYLAVGFHKETNYANFLDVQIQNDPKNKMGLAAKMYYDRVTAIFEEQLKEAHERLAEL